jgi:hypothetical protein
MPVRTLIVVVALAGVACTGGSSTTETSAPTSAGGAPPSVNVSATIVPGEWTYDLRGLKATFTWKESGQPTLSVKNTSGAEVGAPAIYVVTQEQKHVDGSIDGAQPIADGASSDDAVTFPSDLQRDDVGLVVLTLGDENYGALAPKVIEGSG